jgi:16S rRNA (adenine1518-N6/adenine1519-N6)-dimethyltransferase
VDKVIRAIAPQPDQCFLEIGPGRGALTTPLAARIKRLCAVEIDRDMIAGLQAADMHNLTVIEGDFLDQQTERLKTAIHGASVANDPIRVAGNLPYNVASPIMFKLVALIDEGLPIVDATVMLQREVADRLTAVPGTGDYGVLAVLLGYRARVTRVLALPPGAFRPSPRVDSALVRLTFHEPAPAAHSPVAFAELVHAIFTRRRKTVANALLAYPPAAVLAPSQALRVANLDGRRRPETLSIPELIRLSDAFIASTGPEDS